MKYRFLVEGMTCAVCSGSVEKVVSRMDGVKRAVVNLSAKTLLCECEDHLQPEDIIRRVEAAGFSAALMKDRKARGGDDRKRTLCRLAFSLCFLVVLLYLAMGEMLGLPLPNAVSRTYAPQAHALVQLALCIPVLLVNYGFFVRGVQAVRRGGANMDTLVALGSAAALVYSVLEIVLFFLGVREKLGNLYLESSAMILTLVTFGKLLEERAKAKTSSALRALNELIPQTVHALRDGAFREVDAEEVCEGDVILVRPGERICVDGVVQNGESSLDTAALTGESLPRDVRAGDEVLSGSINLSGALEISAQRSVEESTLSQMIALVEEAGVSRAPAARLADRVASVFVPVVTALSVLTVVIWCALGYDVSFALGLGISVLVVSCPCALGLATPVAVTAALGKCAAGGVLIRDAAVFDRLHAADTVVFDKSGTHTEGAPSVTDVFSLADQKRFLDVASALEGPSEHPLARAVCRFAPQSEAMQVSGFEAVFGRGVRAEIDGEEALGGNAAFLTDCGVDVSELSERATAAEKAGKTVLYFAHGGKLLGALALSDRVKEGAAQAVEALAALSRASVMLTGDQPGAAESIAAACGISRVRSEVLPQQKEAEVRRLQEEGCKVVMVGDGINDAPALMRAEVGVSVGSGTDIAQNAADVILLYHDLRSLPKLISYSGRVRRIISENLFWAFFYNCCMIPVAAGALYLPFGITLSPMIAAGCMCLSSLFVVTNALRLYRGKE